MLSVMPHDATKLAVVEIDDENRLFELAGAWNALAGQIPFRAFEWNETWWRHYRDQHSRLFVLAVTDAEGAVVGIAPWYLHRSPRDGRIIRFLGSGEVCSDYMTVLCRDEWRATVVGRLADWLADEASHRWQLMDLNGVADGDPTMELLAERMAEHGHQINRRPDESSWRVELPGDWQAFLGGLSKSRRDRTRTLLRKAVDSGRTKVCQVLTEDDFQRGFEILVELHQKRRRSLGQAGCFSSEEFTGFHREMAQRLLASGQLRLLWTELEGRPMTVEYGFVAGGVVYYYQTGFEPELAHESPGTLALAISLKQAIDEGYQVFDFLRGDESYKASYGATALPLVQLRIVGKQPSARVRYATRRGAEAVKGWALQLLARSKG